MNVGVTSDIRTEDGGTIFDLSLLDEALGIDWEWMRGEGELEPEDVATDDAIVLFHPSVTARTLRLYFFSAGIDVAGPMPHTWITAGSFLAPS